MPLTTEGVGFWKLTANFPLNVTKSICWWPLKGIPNQKINFGWYKQKKNKKHIHAHITLLNAQSSETNLSLLRLFTIFRMGRKNVNLVIMKPKSIFIKGFVDSSTTLKILIEYHSCYSYSVIYHVKFWAKFVVVILLVSISLDWSK